MIPNLIHPIKVTIERMNTSEMVMDDDAREPIHGARSASSDAVIIDAQIKIESEAAPDYEPGGPRQVESGYILCRTKDMDQKLGSGVIFKRGDRITKMGRRTGLDLYITRHQPMGHWPDQQGTTIIRFYYEGRDPVQVG